MNQPAADPKMVAAAAAQVADGVQSPPINPLLARARIPGQTFALPSKGVFYTQGEVAEEVLDNNGEIMIHPMVTLDELIMKTPDRLLNGTALAEVFSRCIPQITQPQLLLAKDVDFLLICLRRVTYGEGFTVEHTHSCENAKAHSYVIPLDQMIKSGKKLNETTAKSQYSLTLPNQQVVQLTPPRYIQMLKLYQTIDDTETDERMIAKQVIEGITSIISNVDTINDKNMIREWVAQIPAGYADDISKRVGELGEWGPETTHTVKCRDCGEDMTLEVSLNPISFFS